MDTKVNFFQQLRLFRLGATKRRLIVAVVIAAAAAMPFSSSAEEYALKVDGLACPFCAYGLEKQLYKVDGVNGVNVDVETATASVFTAEGKEMNQTQAQKAVDAAGFSLRSFTSVQTGSAHNAKPHDH